MTEAEQRKAAAVTALSNALVPMWPLGHEASIAVAIGELVDASIAQAQAARDREAANS